MTEKSAFLAALLAAGVGFARSSRGHCGGSARAGPGSSSSASASRPTSSTRSASARSRRRRAPIRLSRQVDDRLIPGTLNVGHALPTLAQAFIYITLIEVDVLTLASLVAAAALGAWLGAAVVSRWSRRAVRLGMGVALCVAARADDVVRARLAPQRRGGARPVGREAGGRHRGQLRARRADDRRHRPVCAVHGARQPARDGARDGISRS